jgi:hypothetical protein
MPLLDIKLTKKISVKCTLEESTAEMVDQYAAFLGVAGDDVVNKALNYVFAKDSDFQKYRAGNPTAPKSLKIQKPVKVSPTARKTSRMGSIAAD